MDFTTNDLQITNGDLSMNSGETSIQQALQQALQVWLGEWFLDTTVGVPYRQQILVKNPNIDVIQGLIIDAATKVPGVTEITDFSMDYSSNNRSLTIALTAQTSNGQEITAQASVGSIINGTIEGTPT